jgi:Protein of unknown function (DUF2971)
MCAARRARTHTGGYRGFVHAHLVRGLCRVCALIIAIDCPFRHLMRMGQKSLAQLFFFHLFEAGRRVREGNRLVHYTNAGTALKIISGKQVWLRNAHLMNDYSEMRHGLLCLQESWASPAGKQLCDWLEANWPGFKEEIEETFNDHLGGMTDHTFIMSLSEHDDDEDEYGRLSMWRAYGGSAGVALVLNPAVLLSETDEMQVFSTPVIYKDVNQFKEWFETWVGKIISEEENLRAVDRQVLLNHFFFAFRTFVLATKHPGFREEREWRVFHSPMLDSVSPWISTEVVTLNGVPQHVIKVALKDDPEKGVVGAAPEKLLNRVIIGPCETPLPIRNALGQAMIDANIPDPWDKIWMSFIPLRERQ